MNESGSQIMKLCVVVLILINSCFANEKEENAIVEYLSKNTFLHGKAELVFLLDRSGSVGAANFEEELGFVESFLTHIVVDVNASRVAVISYSDTAEIHIDYLREPKTKCFLSQELQDVVFKDSRATNTAAALEKARLVLQNARPNVNKVVVLISDGIATLGGSPVPYAERLKGMGAQIFCFGIGRYLKPELERLASSEKHVYSCSEYRQFKRLARKIRGDPHETSWSGQTTTPNCDHLCESPYKGEPNDPGCCDHEARCSCALLSGMHTCVCGPGHYGLSGLAGQCRVCPKGTYKTKLEPVRKCTLCPAGSTTTKEASTKISDCICKEGYEGDPSKGIACTLKKCPPLQEPTHGYLLGNCEYTYGSVCHFMCEEGYELVDQESDVRTCESNGVWSGNTTICRRIRCNAPPTPQYGSISCESSDLLAGRKCTFGCWKGYIMEGSTERECLSSKQWSGKEVKCIPVECELPPTLKHGRVYGCKTNVRPKFRESCAFRCNEGFDLKGAKFLVCKENGTLQDSAKETGRKPTCEDVTPPEITCPGPLVLSAQKAENYAKVNWESPQPTDNSGISPKMYTEPNFTVPPIDVTIGKATVRYIAVDHAGLKAYCNIEILVYDDDPPTVTRCPSKVEVTSDDVLEPVFWEEPVFQDNSKQPVTILKSANSGDKFGPGRHTVTYRASDANNNVAECIFEVIMTRNTCPYYPPPANGAFACDDWLYGQICQAYCNEKYDFVEQPADWYTCTSESKWTTVPLNMPTPWPDCAKPALPVKIRRMLKGFYYQGDCNDPEVQIYIKKMFLNHLMSEFKKAELCVQKGACNLQTVKLMCGQTTKDLNMKRVRRDVWEHAEREELELEFEITINVDQEFNDTEAMLHDFLETIQNLKWDTDDDFMLQPATQAPFPDSVFSYENDTHSGGSVVITEGITEVVCKQGSVLNSEFCVLCAPGTYYEASVQKCWDCPLGYFQEYEGQMVCERCPVGMSTEHQRSRHHIECKGICQPGTYSETGLDTCMTCPLSTYQEYVGQHTCNLCPEGKTTAAMGSISEADCKDLCEAGSYSKTGLKTCDLCPKGYYQSLFGETKCLECPKNFSTAKEGSKSILECLDLDPCSTKNVCLNEGICIRIGRDAMCICKDGFEGVRCEEDINECDQRPCFNNGRCVNSEGSYYCNCASGFTGTLCDIEVNECLSFPCMNNATCLDKVDDYVCLCPAGYEGGNCETAQEICFHDIICMNGGSCIFEEGSNESFCACQPGYGGIDCSKDINDCENVTCRNNGSCVDEIASYKCICANGYTGDNCEVDIDECAMNQCSSASTCEDLIGAYKCLCPPGWSGTFCETKLDSNFVLNFPESTATIANMATMTLNSPLSDVTVSMWVQTTDTEHSGTPMSYAVASIDGDEAVIDNALTISDCSGVHIYVNNEPLVTDVQVADGQWHHLAFVWSSVDSGKWYLYKDGKLQSSGKDLKPSDIISGGGTLVIGQEQDTIGGGFSPVETFTGNITRVNVWNSSFSNNNITRLCSLDDDIPGKVVAWPDFLQGIKGKVNILNNQRPTLEAQGIF